MQDIECPFCNPEVINPQTIYEIWGWRVVENIKPLVPYHIMLIPKKHIRSFYYLDPSEKSGYWLAYNWAYNYVLERTDVHPMSYTNSPHQQSVTHLHQHLLPTELEPREVELLLKSAIDEIDS